LLIEEEKRHILLPFSMYACNVNLGVVSVVRLEEWRVFELLAEGCMLSAVSFGVCCATRFWCSRFVKASMKLVG